MRYEVATVKSSTLPARLVDALFDVPVMTIPRAGDLLGVTHRAATQHVERLVALGILKEITTADARAGSSRLDPGRGGWPGLSADDCQEPPIRIQMGESR
jgi:hypothetical protein